MKKNRDIFVKLAILCAGYGVFSDAVVVPLISSIFAEFPDSSTFLMNFIITGPALISIPVALIAGELARYVSKKDILIVGFMLYLVGGLGGAYANSMVFLAVMRTFSGAAAGIIGVLAMALIPEIYSDLRERGQVIGWYNATSALFGIGMTFAAGLLAIDSWRNAFYVNAFSVVSLLLIIFFLPRTAPEGRRRKEKAVGKKVKYPFGKVTLLMLACFTIGVLYCVIYYTIDIYVAEKALGSSALSGTLTAFGTLASFLCSLIFGSFYYKVRRFMPVIFFLVCGISFVLLSLVNNIILISMGCMLAGGSYGISLSYYAMVLSETVPESDMSLSMSYFFIVINVAVFLSPYVPILIQKIPNVITYNQSFLYIGIMLGIAASISLMNNLVKMKRSSTANKADGVFDETSA